MNVALCAHIIFPATANRGALSLRRINSCTGQFRISDISQRASIVLPRRISALREKEIKTYIKRNDPVEIKLGYNGDLKTEFVGTVSSVGAGIPIEIVVRDEMYTYIQKTFSASYESCHVPTLLKALMPTDVTVDALDVTIGPQTFKSVTVGEVLKYLSDEFSLYTFLKGGVVYCGKRFGAAPVTHTYNLEGLVKEDNLTYKDGDEIRIKLEATSVLPGGERFKVTVGDEDGEIRKLSYFNVATANELTKLAELDLDKFKYSGYKGTITSYGTPPATYGDYAKIVSPQFPERDATVLIEEMKFEFTDSPEFSRTLTLDGAAG